MRISDWSSDVCSSDLRLEAALQEAPRGLRHRLGIAQSAGGSVGAHLVVEPAKQPVAGQLGDLAGEIPQRQVERPAAAVMELDVGKDPVVTLDVERGLADERMLVALDPHLPVARETGTAAGRARGWEH